MKVVREGDKSVSYGGRFTGTVELEMLHATPTDDQPDTALVHFKDGAVTFWHLHPGGQQLFVVLLTLLLTRCLFRRGSRPATSRCMPFRSLTLLPHSNES